MEAQLPLFLTECPRDAMQGWKDIIPTDDKIEYMNLLMKVGFNVLDCGSFVSPKAIPQMADTAEVLHGIDKTVSKTQLSVIVANIQGARQALEHNKVDILGFPFSISETFQQRNTKKSRKEAFEQIKEIKKQTESTNKQLNVYFSMAFGNPYGEAWNIEEIIKWAKHFLDIGVEKILLSDTTGMADETSIKQVFEMVLPQFPTLHFGAHFHNRYEDAYPKIKAAYDAGCTHFDSAIKGIGGCPYAKDELVGNMPTEQMINFIAKEKLPSHLNLLDFERAYNKAKSIFNF